MTRELVMYSRRQPCPWVTLAKQTLQLHDVPWRELLIDEDEEAHGRLLAWVGFLSVPTLIIAEGGSDLPLEAPRPLDAGISPRGIDRGSMISEPGMAQLSAWLLRNGLLAPASLARPGIDSAQPHG